MKDPAGGVCVEEAEAEEEEEGGERKTGVPAAVASAAAVWAEGEPRAAPGPALPRGRDSGAWLPPSWRKTTPVLIPALEESHTTCWALILLFLLPPHVSGQKAII
ncbi:uncharacterized protein LOC123635560 isoform X3 [Lemur catta]|uniref:uncharacterized protein LOC123635560 isoform X3 n=1 Tax=Lemur catta TaxID=9447 RepID=UPI001E268DA1|nr:uncharacterized protein LOC123635560 isoform X3 [Lemur catta]